jgi:hypothetical protein
MMRTPEQSIPTLPQVPPMPIEPAHVMRKADYARQVEQSR